mmetsp:Transcript_13807/g.40972  ORF Transcript_13807/g.40972 Transcript_13807/m.40972 type:complete len:430 (+) Transcript_13807:282-1571(+)
MQPPTESLLSMRASCAQRIAASARNRTSLAHRTRSSGARQRPTVQPPLPLLGPSEARADGALPAGAAGGALVCRDVGRKGARALPDGGGHVAQAAPHASADAGHDGGAGGGRLDVCGALDGHVEQVGLRLEELVGERDAAIDAEGDEGGGRVEAHRVHDVLGLERDALEHRARDVALVVSEGEPHERTARVVAPVGGEQPTERRDKVDTVRGGHLRGEARHLRRRPDHPERVTEPVDPDRAARDRPLERVRRRRAGPQPIERSREQPVRRRHDPLAGVHQQESARPVRDLSLPHVKAALADHRTLLVADDTAQRRAVKRAAVCHTADDLGRRDDLRQRAARRAQAQRVERGVAPLATAEVHHHRARRVGDVGHMARGAAHTLGATGEVPQEPAVDGAEERRAVLHARLHRGHVVHQPAQLHAAEVGGDR